MRRIHERVGALDVHRDTVMAATRLLDRSTGEIVEQQQQFSTTTAGVVGLGRWLLDQGASTIGMEATGDYWKPVYYGLEGMFDELRVCNAQHVKNVPGRKSDLSDAMWLADVIAHGMVGASFVPPEPIRELRDLSRYRKTQVDIRAKEIQRLEKVLQDACVKITSVASTVWSKSSRRMIEALITGERDPAVLADLALGKMRPKIRQLTEALAANWRPHHSLVAGQIIAHIDHLDASIDALSNEIGQRCDPFAELIDRMCEVPGVSHTTAEIVIAETGADMSRFPTPEQLSAWAGVAPANPRIGRETATGRNPQRTATAAPRPDRSSQIVVPQQRQLPRRPIQTNRPAQRIEQSGRRRGPQHPGHLVAPDGRQHRTLPRPRPRLLRKAPRPPTRSPTTRRPTRPARLHRHHRTRRLTARPTHHPNLGLWAAPRNPDSELLFRLRHSV